MSPLGKRATCWGIAGVLMGGFVAYLVVDWTHADIEVDPGVAALVIIAVLALGFAGFHVGRPDVIDELADRYADLEREVAWMRQREAEREGGVSRLRQRSRDDR